MRRIILFLTIVICSFGGAAASGFSNESLHYVISYKWGMIHKDAGEATLSLRRGGENYLLMLSAKTKPWADKFFMVRDTLSGLVRISDLKPLEYTKISHEGGKYGKDVITYRYSGRNVTGSCMRLREKDGKVSESEKTLTATGPVFDMLSVFYYLRQLDYATLSGGQPVKATVFSGSKSETITIRCIGKEKIKMRNNTRHEAFHIKFNFTSDGKKKSSDDIDCWISTDTRHIPLYLVGKLPIGQVRAYFVG